MMERVISLNDDAEAVRVFGVHDRNLKLLRKHYTVEVTARERTITVTGGRRQAQAPRHPALARGTATRGSVSGAVDPAEAGSRR